MSVVDTQIIFYFCKHNDKVVMIYIINFELITVF